MLRRDLAALAIRRAAAGAHSSLDMSRTPLPAGSGVSEIRAGAGRLDAGTMLLKARIHGIEARPSRRLAAVCPDAASPGGEAGGGSTAARPSSPRHYSPGTCASAKLFPMHVPTQCLRTSGTDDRKASVREARARSGVLAGVIHCAPRSAPPHHRRSSSSSGAGSGSRRSLLSSESLGDWFSKNALRNEGRGVRLSVSGVPVRPACRSTPEARTCRDLVPAALPLLDGRGHHDPPGPAGTLRQEGQL